MRRRREAQRGAERPRNTDIERDAARLLAVELGVVHQDTGADNRGAGAARVGDAGSLRVKWNRFAGGIGTHGRAHEIAEFHTAVHESQRPAARAHAGHREDAGCADGRGCLDRVDGDRAVRRERLRRIPQDGHRAARERGWSGDGGGGEAPQLGTGLLLRHHSGRQERHGEPANALHAEWLPCHVALSTQVDYLQPVTPLEPHSCVSRNSSRRAGSGCPFGRRTKRGYCGSSWTCWYSRTAAPRPTTSWAPFWSASASSRPESGTAWRSRTARRPCSWGWESWPGRPPSRCHMRRSTAS